MQLLLEFEPDTRLPTIHTQLIAIHGPERDADRYPPITRLFRAMTGSRTKDAKSGQAFLRLCEFLSSWHTLAEADPKTIAEVISLVHYANRKAHPSQACLCRRYAHQAAGYPASPGTGKCQ